MSKFHHERTTSYNSPCFLARMMVLEGYLPEEKVVLEVACGNGLVVGDCNNN